VVEDLPRTNNSLESWHKVFELTCKKHPSVNKLIEHFRIEQQNTDILYDQIQAGDIYPRKKQSILKDEAIIAILSEHKKKSDSFKTLEKLIKVID
jgi:hypothetical protein